MVRRGFLVILGATVLGYLALSPRPAMADHESVGIVVCVGEGEVVLHADGHSHVVALTPGTVLLDERGRAVRAVSVGDTVRERCRPPPEGGRAAAAKEAGA